MSTLKTVTGTYGSGKTPCEVFIYETPSGNWYVVDGGSIVNCTWEDITDGVDVEEIQDFDCFTWTNGIYSPEELERAVLS